MLIKDVIQNSVSELPCGGIEGMPIAFLHLFRAITVGIFVGVGIYFLALILSFVMTQLLLMVDKIPGTKASEFLVLRGRQETMDYDVLFNSIDRYCKSYKEKSRTVKCDETELIIEIKAKEREVLLESLENMEFLTQVDCISCDG